MASEYASGPRWADISLGCLAEDLRWDRLNRMWRWAKLGGSLRVLPYVAKVRRKWQCVAVVGAAFPTTSMNNNRTCYSFESCV